MEAVELPISRLEPATLRRVVEEFVCREGTDYGTQENSLEDKVNQVLKRLKEGSATLMYDPQSESTTIITRE